MTGTRPDLMLAGDLVALADDNRRELRTLAETLRSQGAYRDDRLGTEARRDELANLRRFELATLPLALAHVFVHRVQRAAAGGVAVVAVIAMFLASLDPVLRQLAQFAVPGFTVTAGVALVAVATLAAYVVAGWIAERVFERRMRAAIVAGGDPHTDLDRLAEGPIELARGLVRRADGWAVALGIAGITALVAMISSIALFDAIALRYPVAASVLARPLAHNALQLMNAIGFAIVPAALIGRACHREHRRGALPRWTRWLGMSGALVIGGGIAAGTLIRVVRVARRMELGPSGAPMLHPGLVASGITAAFVISVWLVLWWRRREQARLG